MAERGVVGQKSGTAHNMARARDIQLERWCRTRLIASQLCRRVGGAGTASHPIRILARIPSAGPRARKVGETGQPRLSRGRPRSFAQTFAHPGRSTLRAHCSGENGFHSFRTLTMSSLPSPTPPRSRFDLDDASPPLFEAATKEEAGPLPPKRGELEYRSSIYSIRCPTICPSTPSQQGASASTSTPKEVRRAFLLSKPVFRHLLSTIIRSIFLLLSIVAWGISSTSLRRQGKTSVLPYLSLIFLVVGLLQIYYIYRAARQLYLPFRRRHLRTLPHLQRQLDPRTTDGKTVDYAPRGLVKTFERWVLFYRPAQVLPAAPLPPIPMYSRGTRDLDAVTLEVLADRAASQGVALSCEC